MGGPILGPHLLRDRMLSTGNLTVLPWKTTVVLQVQTKHYFIVLQCLDRSSQLNYRVTLITTEKAVHRKLCKRLPLPSCILPCPLQAQVYSTVSIYRFS